MQADKWCANVTQNLQIHLFIQENLSLSSLKKAENPGDKWLAFLFALSALNGWDNATFRGFVAPPVFS